MTWYVVDGMDGSGKTTAADILRAELEGRGRRVLVMTHPNTDLRIGRLERALLQKEGKASLLVSTSLYIVDILHSLAVMRVRGGRYDDVIFVRYIMAVAYLPDGLCGKAYTVISRILPMPDVAMLVDVEPETAMSRISGRGEDLEVFETVERLGTVRGRMLGLADGWAVLDNRGDADGLGAQIAGLIQERPR